MHAFDPAPALWPPRPRPPTPQYDQHYYQSPPVFEHYTDAAGALYSPKTESPITPTDAGPYDAPAVAVAERSFVHTLAPAPRFEKPAPYATAAFPRYPADFLPPPPDQSPASEIADPWGYDPQTYAPAPQFRYPHLGTRDTAAFDAHGRHLPLRRHALYPPRLDDAAAYRRPPAPPPPPPAPVPVPPTIEHQLKETHSIPPEMLDSVFNTVGASGGGGRRAWVCQQCSKSVRKQDRAAHMLSHQGKKRYDCSCGKRFGRPQDADRHIREQAPCQSCEGKMGRYGKDGRCSTCVLELEHGPSSARA